MTGIELYSTTAANNNSAVPNGWPEGMAPSGVNDAARQMMAAIRTWYEDAEWINLGDTPTYIGATQFSLVGDKTATYQVGRRIRAVGTTPFTIYGTISVSAFSSVTTVTVVWDSGSLNATLASVSLGSASVTNPSIGTASIKDLASALPPYTAASASGPASLDFAEDTDNGVNKVTIAAPASLTANRTATFPDATGNVVLDTATQTLSGKTFDGSLAIAGTSSEAGYITLGEDADNGSNTMKLQAPASLGSDITVTGPSSTGTLALTSQLTSTLLQTNTPSAASESVFASGINSTYSIYEFRIIDMVMSVDDSALQVRTSSNAGVSYDAGVSDYQVTRQFQASSASAWTVVGSTSSSAVSLNSTGSSAGIGNAAGEGASLTLQLINPSGSLYKTFRWFGSYINAAGNVVHIQGSATRFATTDIDAIQFLPSSGTFTGTIKMAGIV